MNSVVPFDSELRYRRLFEAARDGILILDPVTRRIIDVNPFLMEFLGYTYEEFIGKELFEIGLLKNVTASRAAFRELRRTGFVRYDDLPLLTKDGRQCEVEFVCNIYREGARSVIHCNIRDISARKETDLALRMIATALATSEWRFRRVFELSQEGILMVDPETRRIVDVNPFLIELLAYTHAEFVGKELWEIGLLEDGVAREAAFLELEAARRMRCEGLSLKTKDGRRVEVELVGHLCEEGDRRIVQCHIRDVTAEKKAVADLRLAQAQLARRTAPSPE